MVYLNTYPFVQCLPPPALRTSLQLTALQILVRSPHAPPTQRQDVCLTFVEAVMQDSLTIMAMKWLSLAVSGLKAEASKFTVTVIQYKEWQVATSQDSPTLRVNTKWSDCNYVANNAPVLFPSLLVTPCSSLYHTSHTLSFYMMKNCQFEVA